MLHSELSLSKGEEALKKLLNKLGDFVKRLARKVVESLSANVGNAFGLTLRVFFGKSAWFVAKNTLVLIAFVAGLI